VGGFCLRAKEQGGLLNKHDGDRVQTFLTEHAERLPESPGPRRTCLYARNAMSKHPRSSRKRPSKRPAKRETKLTPDTELSAQKAVNLIEAVALDMGFLWHPRGPFDPGIDGRIELRDVRSKEPLNRYIGVQSKGWAKYTAEDAEGFEFLCDAGDIKYWTRSLEPVLLICAHPNTGEAWSVCVTDWFSDAERRAARRVVFNKDSDRFDASKAEELLRFAFRSEPVVPHRPSAPPEELITNLVPILEHGSRVWSARCKFDDHSQVHERYEELGGPRASDYLLKDGRLYSLRDPRSCPLRHLCYIEDLESVPAEAWSGSDDAKLRHYWVELLRRTLLHQVKHQLRWHRDRGLFYFPAPTPLEERSVEGPNGPRLVVKVEYWLDKRSKEQCIGYIRHQAFRPGFQRVDGRWHLEIEPNYLFTRDGEREHHRAAEYLAGIKRLDKNLAVIGHLRMWEHVLTRPASLLDAEPPLLTFGTLATVEVPVGIDDALWRGKSSGDEGLPGQDELAA
jgi:hypothetical protein